MDIGKNIKYLRELKGLSQFDVAEKMGVSQKTYSGIEKRGNKITIEQMNRIAKMLDVSIKELYELDDKEIVNGRALGNKAAKAQLAFSNATSLNSTNKIYNELISTKDELIAAMREELERLKKMKKNA